MWWLCGGFRPWFRRLRLGLGGRFALNFALMGRGWAYALAASGGGGVAHVLKLIEAEMRVAMALTACTSIAEIDADALSKRP